MDILVGLAPGVVLNNAELMGHFRCSNNGGMRRSHATGTLVVVSDHTKGLYDDRWIDDTLHYTGMGLRGPQRLDFAQNKTLAHSATNGVAIHLFEVFAPGQYSYLGEARLAGEPYQEEQPDVQGHLRTVWIFPLGLVDCARLPAPSIDVVEQPARRRERLASRMDDEELRERGARGRPEPGRREVTTKQYDRDPFVAEYAKRTAAGKCRLCGERAPFEDRSGKPYLEVHHIIWLSRNGADVLENVAALCPNCHRRMHVLDLESDRQRLLYRSSR